MLLPRVMLMYVVMNIQFFLYVICSMYVCMIPSLLEYTL
jgi:hypothetical protein